MSTINEIIAFSNGDSNSIKTWSNVPYYLLRALENQDILVHRENIQLQDQNLVFQRIVKTINGCIRNLGRIGYPNRTLLCTLDRTRLYNFAVQSRINRVVHQWPNAQVLLSFDFSHTYTEKSDKLRILLCDWTIQYEIVEHQKRKPTRVEQLKIRDQEKVLSKADLVVTLFPNVYDVLARKYGRQKVAYLGHIVNCDENYEIDLCDKHYNSRRILFIGRKAYRTGAIALIRAVKMYNNMTNDRLYIDIIGMNQEDTGVSSNNVTYYGYLDKQKPDEKRIYYSLMETSKCIVNTTENWMGASSIIEAMYWQIPIIINPTDDIIKIFGEKIDCGFYCKSNIEEDILECLSNLMTVTEVEYKAMCTMARERVARMTWGTFAKKLIEIMKDYADDKMI